ncbi:cI repressor protein [Pseudomonas sp. RIT-PI-q]|uniref:LexA family transcriptional regulator n=1 Tax=Pseudomonas sp. RIT-PI-q TaxID=1690247 RepID=UPI0006CC9AA0|nr:LexA family transcriptional regulator [Pseudomonas sp. RIT-PI-q]KPG98366.1 cI repressor protein [Pseudomonas sp. RIT-PI-q]
MKKDSRRLPLSDWQLQDSERLKAIFQKKRGELKLTQEKMAGELGDGVTQGAVSHFMNGRTALSTKAVTVFARMLRVPVSEISPTLAAQVQKMASSLGDSSAALPSLPKSKEAANTPLPAGDDIQEPTDERYAFVSQYTARAAAGDGHDNPHVEIRSTLAFKKEWLRVKGLNPKNLKVIYADGDSMWPTVSDRDVLLVDESRLEPTDGQIYVLASADKGVIVKRLIKTALGSWIIRSDNEDKNEYPDLMLSRSEINEHRIIGRVVWRGGDL